MDRILVQSTNSSWKMKLLPAILSLVAGSVDVVSFLGLNGLFVSHITGNLVILAVHIVHVGNAPIALILSVPVFIMILGLTKLLVSSLEKAGRDSLQPLLILQFIFLVGFLVLGVTAGSHINPDAPNAVLAGMLGVSAMAVQNALVQLPLKGMPATAVMTTNVTHFVIDIVDVLVGRHSKDTTEARNRAKGIWPALVGFTIGCALGAVGEAKFGLWALMLPVTFALIASIVVYIERSFYISGSNSRY